MEKKIRANSFTFENYLTDFLLVKYMWILVHTDINAVIVSKNFW